MESCYGVLVEPRVIGDAESIGDHFSSLKGVWVTVLKASFADCVVRTNKHGSQGNRGR